MIGLVAADLTATLDFYRLLGMDIPAGAETEPHVEVALPGGLRLGFDTEETVRSFDPEWQPGTPGSFALAFLCADPAEVDEAFATVTGAGYRGAREPFDAFWGQRYATVLDPDGVAVDLFAPLPTS